MDFAHETKRNKKQLVAEEQQAKEDARHGYPYGSFWELLNQCDSIRPLLRKIEFP
jgi:hypothetical protein